MKTKLLLTLAALGVPAQGTVLTDLGKKILSLLILVCAVRVSADVDVPCNGLAFFTQQPTNTVSCAGDSLTLTASFRGAYGNILHTGGGLSQYSYVHHIQWRRNYTNIPGAFEVISPSPALAINTIALTLSNVVTAQSGLYDVVITNQCNLASSEPAFVSVGPGVLVPPQSTTGQVCQTTMLSVQAVGAGSLTYQWRLDGSDLVNSAQVSGAQSSQLTLGPLIYALEGNYDVVVRNDCASLNSTTSAVARVTVTPLPSWVLRATNGPPARTGHALAYDSVRHVTVLFSGGQFISSQLGYELFGDLWEWNGARWIQRLAYAATNGWSYTPAAGWKPAYADWPVARRQHGLAFDSRRGRVVLFGGRATAPAGGNQFLRDTWEWDGLRWYFRATNGPSSRDLHAMAYDSDRGVTVLYGGFLDTSGQYGLVWEWDGTSWSSIDPTNGPSRNYHQTAGKMAYDSFRHRTFYGPSAEISPNVFWDWNGLSWATRGPGYNQTIINGNVPMTFDSYRRRTVTFGGIENNAPTSQTWNWDGSRWEQWLPAASPPARSRQDMAYDSTRHVLVLMGGNADVAGQIQLGDTWELQALDRPLINDQPASQYRQPGETATFSVTAVGPGTLDYQWRRDGLPLADSGRISGATTPTLTITNLNAGDTATYTVQVANSCASTLSLPAILTLDLRMQIFSSANTITLVWGATNVVLEQASVVTGPWTVVPGASSPFPVGLFPPGYFFRLRQL